VFEAGAVGLVIYNNVLGPFRGVLTDQPDSGDFSLISWRRAHSGPVGGVGDWGFNQADSRESFLL